MIKLIKGAFKTYVELERQILQMEMLMGKDASNKYRILTNGDGFRVQTKGKYWAWNYVYGSEIGGPSGPVYFHHKSDAMMWIEKDIKNKKEQPKTHRWKPVKIKIIRGRIL